MKSFHRSIRWRSAAAISVALLFTTAAAPLESDAETSLGVFSRLAHAPAGSFERVTAELEQAVLAEGWELLANYQAGMGDKCTYRARVYVLHSADYAAGVLEHGPLAAFALPVRMAVYEDEAGVHISAVNAQSMTRTIISETDFAAQSREMMAALDQIVRRIDGVEVAAQQYGQMREAGLIAKTMGIMAGGPFPSKVETIATTRASDVTVVAEKLMAGLEELAMDWDWDIAPVYRLDLPDHGIAILGVTSGAVESRSFRIVGEGNEPSRSEYACPGLAHAAAYPIELVLSQNGDEVDVLLVDVMFRMKMYFEDAGKVAFATNMRMPGSIESEIRDKVEETIY